METYLLCIPRKKWILIIIFLEREVILLQKYRKCILRKLENSKYYFPIVSHLREAMKWLDFSHVKFKTIIGEGSWSPYLLLMWTWRNTYSPQKFGSMWLWGEHWCCICNDIIKSTNTLILQVQSDYKVRCVHRDPWEGRRVHCWKSQ